MCGKVMMFRIDRRNVKWLSGVENLHGNSMAQEEMENIRISRANSGMKKRFELASHN